VRNRPYYFQNQGCSDTLPAIISVKSVSAGNVTDTLSDTKDYSTFTDEHNQSGIILLSTAIGGGDTGLTSQSLRIRYEYGAIASYQWRSGGLNTITPMYHRLTNIQTIDGVTKYRYITVYSASMNKGVDFAFKNGNDADSVLESPFEVMGEIDSTRDIGDQLFIIEDEAAAA
jgi:hypothetical protein